MKFKESTLKEYAAPLSETENQKCLNAIGMVRDALKDLGFTDYGTPITPLYSDTYAYALEMRSTTADRKIKLFIQGSYANNTNVRTQSDVDIAVVQEDIFRTEYRNSTIYPQSDSDYGQCHTTAVLLSLSTQTAICFASSSKQLFPFWKQLAACQ